MPTGDNGRVWNRRQGVRDLYSHLMNAIERVNGGVRQDGRSGCPPMGKKTEEREEKVSGYLFPLSLN